MTEALHENKEKLTNTIKDMEAMEVRLNNEKFDELRKIKEDFLG